MITRPEVEEKLLTYTVSSLNHSQVSRLFDDLKLTEYFRYFTHVMIPAPKEHYHGKVHMLSTALNAYEGCRFFDIPMQNMRIIIVAALFHDIFHSCGAAEHDIENIRIANNTVYQLWTSISDPEQNFTIEEIEEVFKLIRLTEYPYTGLATTDFERIIRDADLMGTYEVIDPDTCISLFRGLWNEVNLHSTLFKTRPLLKFNEFVYANDNFLANIQWRSDWGKEKARVRNFEQVRKDLIALLLPTKSNVVSLSVVKS